MTRVDALLSYLRTLVVEAKNLNAEKSTLQLAATRIPVINSTLIDLRTDAQTALDRLNQLQGTSLTLAEIIQQLDPTVGA